MSEYCGYNKAFNRVRVIILCRTKREKNFVKCAYGEVGGYVEGGNVIWYGFLGLYA